MRTHLLSWRSFAEKVDMYIGPALTPTTSSAMDLAQFGKAITVEMCPCVSRESDNKRGGQIVEVKGESKSFAEAEFFEKRNTLLKFYTTLYKFCGNYV